MEALIVVVEAATPSWTSDGNVLSIQGTQGMWDVPPLTENGLDLQPVFRACGACHHLISIGPDDSITDLRHKLIYGRPRNPGSKLQGWVAVSTGQVSQCDHQLQSWTQGVSHPGPLPLDLRAESLLQLLKKLWWHQDEISVLTLFFQLCLT